MNRDDIIRMAREVYGDDKEKPFHESALYHLEAFAKLVVADYQERTKWDGIHTCHAECQRPVCVAIRKAVATEREECAKAVEQAGADGYGTLAAALLVRERGAP